MTLKYVCPAAEGTVNVEASTVRTFYRWFLSRLRCIIVLNPLSVHSANIIETGWFLTVCDLVAFAADCVGSRNVI